ncbi:MAG TPA: ABC transporter permease subunit [Steroidobacteraceae bacterium]|nr:ABC transporter permease subunit [Steroidobacteraceae bacterium]
MAPQISYLPLGQRIVSMIDANLQLLAQTAAYRWSVGVLRRLGITGRGLVIAVPAIWLLLFFLIPFVIVVKISLAPSVFVGQPPYGPLIEWTSDHVLQLKLHIQNYRDLFGQDALYFDAFVYSLRVAAVSTVLCLLIAYPMAYGIARASPNWRNTLLLLVVLPFWTSFLIRVYAWIGLLRNNGLINQALMSLGIIDEPIVMMQTDFAMYVGIVYSYLPFMILPLYANLEKHDITLLEAATDLGATPLRAFLRITLPLSIPGIIAGSMLVFIPAVGEFVIPRLLGGTDSLMIGRVLWDEFFTARSWPRASAVAVLLLLVLVLPIVIFQRYQARETSGLAHR